MLSSPSEEYRDQVAELTADQREVLAREARDAAFGFSTLAEYATSGRELPKELAFSVLYVSEARIAQLGKLVGVELESAAAREARYGELRRANLRIAELERQLGQQVNTSAVLPAVAELCKKVKAWWAKEGFGYASEASVGSYGMSVKLSCHLMHGTYVHSTTPASDRLSREAWLASLKERGFELVYPRGDDPAVAATSHNQELLRELVLRTFPSARLGAFSGYMRSADENLNTLREVEIFLPKLEEVAALQVDGADEFA